MRRSTVSTACELGNTFWTFGDILGVCIGTEEVCLEDHLRVFDQQPVVRIGKGIC